MGCTNIMPFHIDLVEGTKPIYVRPYPIPHSQQKVVDEHIEDMLNQGIIQPSVSPFSAPLLLIDKNTYDESGKREKRLVVDFRCLNASTVPQRFPIRLMQETVLNVGKAKIFSSLDLVLDIGK